MFLDFFRIWLRLSLRAYFKRFYWIGKENVPTNGPIIIASNHPSAFLDGFVGTVFLKRPIHYITRGDVFKKSWAEKLLRFFRLIPIYRREEGKENMHKNDDTFRACFNLFENGGGIIIFSEGICTEEKRLRPLRKGTARLALEAEAKNNWQLGLKIIPTGINYTNPGQYGSEVFLVHDKAFDVLKYRESYELNPARAINELTAELQERLKPLVITIPDPADEEAAEYALVLDRIENPDSKEWMSHTLHRFFREREICATTKAGVDMPPLIRKENLFLQLLAVLLYWPGYLLNYIPIGLAKYIQRTKVTRIEFSASVRILGTLVFFILYYTLTSILLFCLLPTILATGIIATMIGLGMLSNWYLHKYLEQNA
jgi:1-acyl-sn-glycerol-3-phosphate acyltransferase